MRLRGGFVFVVSAHPVHGAGLVAAERGAIEHYNHIVEATDGVDYVTQDMVIAILHDEQRHRRLFEGYLREFETR